MSAEPTPMFQPRPMSSLLAQVSTVLSVSSTGLGLGRTDKQASEESARAHQAKVGISRVTVSRLAGAEDRVKEIRGVQIAGSEIAKRFTTAWGDRRLLPNVNIEGFLREWVNNKAEHDRLVERLVADAPQLIETAERNKGTFNVEPPDLDEIRDAFSLDMKMEPVPDASKFQNTTLDTQMEQALRSRFEADIQAAYQHAQKDALTRLAKPLQNLVERLDIYEKREEEKAKGIDVGKAGYFRDTLISNVTEIANVFETFNLTNDPQLKAIADMARGFDGIESDDLKKNKGLRDNTKERAKLILEQLGDWL